MSGSEQRWTWTALVLAVIVATGATACGPPSPVVGPIEPAPSAIVGQPGAPPPSTAPATTTTAPAGPAATPVPPPPPTPTPTPPPTTAPVPGTLVEVAYRLERRVADPATAGFEAMAESVLSDPRGWRRAGFQLVRRPAAPFVVVLAEGPEVDRLCLPYQTSGSYSCQNGPVVALNADRWRTATPKWTGTLEDYRRYLVGHEVGHLLGLRHPSPQCPGPGRPAPLMAQQSTELDGCLPNPWPLPEEVELGRRRPPDLAPPYRR